MTTSTPPSSKRIRDNDHEDPANAGLMPCSETKRLKQSDSESDPASPLPWGCHTHIGGRPYQEDAFLHSSLEDVPQLPGSPKAPTDMYAVFDGHGGAAVSSYLRGNAGAFIAEALRTSGNSDSFVEAALKAAFVALDAGLPTSGKDKGGSTATICLVNEARIICANCGDSRAVMARDGQVVALSEDHSTTREDEVARIEAAGGRIVQNSGPRVMGVLGMTRAIGDTWLRPYGVIPEPDVVVLNRTPQDEVIVVASDGLWGSISSEEAVHIARRCLDRATGKGVSRQSAARIAAKVLMRAAMHRGSRDNVTVLVVDLQPQRGVSPAAGGESTLPCGRPSGAQEVDDCDHPQETSGEESDGTPPPSSMPVTPASSPFKGCNSPHLMGLLDQHREQEDQWRQAQELLQQALGSSLMNRPPTAGWGRSPSSMAAAWGVPPPTMTTWGLLGDFPMAERTCSGRLISTGGINVNSLKSGLSAGKELSAGV